MRKCTGRDQHAAQVLKWFAGRQRVQCLVGKIGARAQFPQDCWCRTSVEPAFHCGRTACGGHGLIKHPQVFGYLPVVGSEKVRALDE
jgi:hypothetical protein